MMAAHAINGLGDKGPQTAPASVIELSSHIGNFHVFFSQSCAERSVRVIGRDKLDLFCSRYATASFLPGKVVIFNVRGNNYRSEVHVAFRNGIVTVLWMCTHSEYDARDRRR